MVVGAAYEVANVLGAGFLEKVYGAGLDAGAYLAWLDREVSGAFSRGLQGPMPRRLHGGSLVDEQLIVELKCVDRFSNEHLAQCIHYLRASGMKLALLINFQKPRIEWKRIVYDL